MFVTLFIILTLCYILIQLTTSFEKRVTVYRMSDPKLTQEDAEAYGRAHGWDDPIPVKYFNWLKGIIKGDWGVSVVKEVGQNPCNPYQVHSIHHEHKHLVPDHFSTPGIPVRDNSGAKKNKPLDYLISFFVIIFISVPSFVL